MIECIALLWIGFIAAAVIPPEPVMVSEYPGCRSPLLIDRTGLGFEDTLGRSTVDRAQYVCYFRYRGCLRTLTRTAEFSFRAICKRR